MNQLNILHSVVLGIDGDNLIAIECESCYIIIIFLSIRENYMVE